MSRIYAHRPPCTHICAPICAPCALRAPMRMCGPSCAPKRTYVRKCALRALWRAYVRVGAHVGPPTRICARSAHLCAYVRAYVREGPRRVGPSPLLRGPHCADAARTGALLQFSQRLRSGVPEGGRQRPLLRPQLSQRTSTRDPLKGSLVLVRCERGPKQRRCSA